MATPAAIKAQGITDAVAARYMALGAYSSHFVDVFSTRANPASLAGLQQSAVAAYTERRFMLEDLNQYSASVGLVTGSGNFALHGSYLGFAQSHSSQLSVSYARKLTATIDIGASFHYFQVRQPAYYGSTSAITGGVGMLIHLSEKVHAGLNVYNPVRAAFSKTDGERLPAQYSFGVGYDASEKLFVSAEIVKTEDRKPDVNAGFQYQFVRQFFIRAGVATLSSNYCAGLGFQFTHFRCDIATSYHPQLGFSPGFLLLYQFGKNKNNEPASR